LDDYPALTINTSQSWQWLFCLAMDKPMEIMTFELPFLEITDRFMLLFL